MMFNASSLLPSPSISISCTDQLLSLHHHRRRQHLNLLSFNSKPWKIHQSQQHSRLSLSTKLRCSHSPNQDEQLEGEEEVDTPVRTEISPTVLRSISSSLSGNHDPNPISSSSLIERNLRKRAMRGRNATTLDSQEFSDNERQCYPTVCPISNVLWEEKPEGLSLESFHNLDFHAQIYRLALFIHLVVDTEIAIEEDIPFSSLVWFGFSPDMYDAALSAWKNISPESSDLEELHSEWRKNVAKDLNQFLNDKSVIEGTAGIFSQLWNTEDWLQAVSRGSASSLVVALTLSAQVDVLSGIIFDENASISLKRRLEGSSAALNAAMLQLNGMLLDPTDLWEKALKTTGFIFGQQVYLCDNAVVFPFTIEQSMKKADFGIVLQNVQKSLDSDERYNGLVAILRKSWQNEDQMYLLIAPWYWFLPLDIGYQFMPIAITSLAVSCAAASQFTSAGLNYGFVWEQDAVPLSWLAILLSSFLANQKFPFALPFPNLGAARLVSFPQCNQPSRKSIINSILNSTVPPILVSFVFLTFGLALWGPEQFNSRDVFDLSGYVLVPQDLFPYSYIFSKLLNSMSVATVISEDEGIKLAASPFVVAGLLGINISVFNLFPGPDTDGMYLLKFLLGNAKLADNVSYALSVMFIISLLMHQPALGLTWLVFSFLAGSESEFFVKDEITEPDLLTKTLGALLIGGAIACFIPFQF